MKEVKVNIPVVITLTDDKANEILNGNITSLLQAIYTPSFKHGEWYVHGKCVVENGTDITV